jgi:hypothetical protein
MVFPALWPCPSPLPVSFRRQAAAFLEKEGCLSSKGHRQLSCDCCLRKAAAASRKGSFLMKKGRRQAVTGNPCLYKAAACSLDISVVGWKGSVPRQGLAFVSYGLAFVYEKEKESIQLQVPLQLPCYDLFEIMCSPGRRPPPCTESPIMDSPMKIGRLVGQGRDAFLRGARTLSN